MIRFENVVVRYRGAERAAVGGVSLVAERGAVTAVAGPNGSGKSTLVRALIGREPLAAGRILLDGSDASALAPRERARRAAVVTQREDPVFPLVVEDYVALGRFPHASMWGAPGATDRTVVREAIAQADIASLARRRTDELSGGEWQRVRIARALAQRAGALVLDEPSTFLDVAHEMGVFELLHHLAESGMTVLLVSHQLNLVARFATQVVLLHQGLVAAAGSPAEVMLASTLERVYDWPLVVTNDPAVGAPALVPLRARRGR